VKRFLLLAGMALAITGAAMAQETAAPAPAPSPTPETQQWTGPVVTLQTTMGDIVVTLDTVGAPRTSEQFLALVRSGHYNGAAFYRIEPGFLIQLGDLDATLKYRDTRRPNVPLETENNRHARGALGLAHAEDPNSGRSTFYIDLVENSGLNATPGAPPNTTGYAAFGHVTAGMEVVDAIAGVELAPEGGPFPGKLPKTPVVVTRAVITQAQ
jgi:peptidyl-prolyl cis-trans isomerase A (cyclophilin A)